MSEPYCDKKQHQMALKPRLILLLLIVIIAGGRPVQAQKSFVIVREKTLAQNTKTVLESKQLDIERGIGKVADLELPYNDYNTATLTLHFVISVAPEKPTWALRLVENNEYRRQLWAYSPVEEKESEFWSDTLPTKSVSVEIYSTQERSPLKIAIDKVLVDIPPVKPEAIINGDQREKILDQPEPRKSWGKSIARIQLYSETTGQKFYCTGFLLSADLVMTNNHCIKSQLEARTAQFVFDYDNPNIEPKKGIKGKKLVAENSGLDFSIVQLREPLDTTARPPLRLSADAPSELLIIEHPGGEHKQVSIYDCKVVNYQIEGLSTKLTDFSHSCDTLGGSSGSPVMNIQTGKVIGLHHLGFAEGEMNAVKPKLLNQAVIMQEIIKFISNSTDYQWLKPILGIQ